MTPSTIRTTFAGSLGHELAARLDLLAAPVRAHALFAHCFTCSKDVIAAPPTSRTCYGTSTWTWARSSATASRA